MPSLEDYIKALRGPILVTGGSGFIGANLFKLLIAHRQDVFAVEKRAKSWRLADVGEKNLLTVDLNDRSATKNLVTSLQPQTVFNCVAYGAYSFEGNAALIYETNVTSIIQLVQLLSEQPFSAFVQAGSSSEYGTNCAAPLEDSTCLPNSDYAVSKLSASLYLSYVGRSRSFPCLNLRLYSVYGPLEDTSRLIPNLLRSALAGTLPHLVDPRISRDFVHVDDVCAAFILAGAKMNPGLYGQSINIGSGEVTTIRDLAYLVKSLFSVSEEPVFGTMESRAWDLVDWYSNSAKALAVLDWKPQVSLATGLSSTAEWVKSLTESEFNVTANKKISKSARSISAIVACYKDELAIPVMHRRLTETFQKLRVDYEIIFVNDGSPDRSAEVIRSISEADPRVIGISHSRNFGSQMAFRSGMELYTKDCAVLLDGDLQDPPELIEQFYSKWESGYDVVYGVRIKRVMSPLWAFLYKAFYRIFAAFSYVRIPLDAGDFSLIDRRVVGWLLNCGERDLFLRGLRAYVGFAQTGIDYVRPERMFGRSTNNLFKNIEWAKKGIFAYSNTPLTMLTSAGVVCLVVTLLLSLVVIVVRVISPTVVPPGVTSVILLIMLFGSFNLFAIGLVGEYVAKITIEVKGRPRLIRSALIRGGNFTELLPDGRARS